LLPLGFVAAAVSAFGQSPSGRARVRFLEEQLSLADENLMQAKEVW